MINSLDELKALYDGYLQSMGLLEKKNSGFQGVWRGMLGGGAGADICNEQFAEGVRLCIERSAEAKPESGEALAVMRFVLEWGRVQSVGRTVGMMLGAVQGYLLPLAAFLDARGAQELLGEYYYDKRTVKQLLPVQKKFMLALREQSGEAKKR